MNPLNIWTFAAIIGALGLLLGALIVGITWAIISWSTRRKLIILNLPEIPGTPATFERRNLPGGFFDKKSNEPTATRSDEDRLLPSAPATYGSNWGPLNIMGAGGFSLVAPSKLEAAKTIEYVAVAEWISNNKRQPQKDEATFREHLTKAMDDAKRLATRFMVWDPLAYRKASRESVMQKLYQSTSNSDAVPWYATFLIIIGILAIVGSMGTLGVLIVKVLPILKSASGS